MDDILSVASQDVELKRRLWQACPAVPGLNGARWRYDHAGLLMKWEEYGNPDSKVAWQLAYVVAPGDGGADHIDNLRAVSLAALHGGEGHRLNRG